MSSAVCLKLVSFFQVPHLGHFGMRCSSVCTPSHNDRIASRDSDEADEASVLKLIDKQLRSEQMCLNTAVRQRFQRSKP
jgi:hypothetical protein